MTQKISGAPMYDGAPFYSKASAAPLTMGINPDAPATCMKWLKMELRYKQYFCDADYALYLKNNGINPDDIYDKATHELGILKTVKAILQTLMHDISYYRTIETGFGTSHEAYTNLQKAMSDIRIRIREVEREHKTKQSDFTYFV